MNEIRGLAAVAALTAALWAGGVAAGSEKPQPVPSRQLTGVFAPDPEGVWRTITPTDSTSDCIGDPVTPMCAIDTRWACFQWNRQDLCEIAVKDFYAGGRFQGGPPTSYTRYRVVGVRIVTKAERILRPRHVLDVEAGDVHIDLIDGHCSPNIDYCSTFEVPTTYTLRKFGEGWKILVSYAPRY